MASADQMAPRFLIIALCSISHLTLTLAQAPAPAPSPSASPSGPSIKLYLAHGILMFLAFGFFLPCGILIPRFAQSFTRFWFHLHWIFQITAVLLVIPAFSIAIHYFDALADSLHAKLGVAVFILILLQPVIAVIRPHKGNLYRPIWYFFHWMFGTVAVILGWYQIFTGLGLFSYNWNADTSSIQNWISGLVAVFAFVYLFLGRWDHMMSQAKADTQVDTRVNDIDSDVSTHPRGPQEMKQISARAEGGVRKGNPNGEPPV